MVRVDGLDTGRITSNKYTENMADRTVGFGICKSPFVAPVLWNSCTTFFNVVTQFVTSVRKISCLTISIF